jgi:hypothetical protein
MVPLISIVVPSKNRHYYLKFLIKYFNSIQSDKIELIIHDNSDSDLHIDFEIFLNSLKDSRIKYFYSSEELSVIENCDCAISKARGEYISMIGDDDVFSKYIIEYAEKFKEYNLDAVLPIKSFYTWPDVKPRLYKEKFSGILRTSNFNFKRTKIDVKKELEKVMLTGGTEILNLPRIYHGILKRTVLEKIFDKTNTYFPGPSPDMANAIAACKFINNFEIIDVPLLISGHSILSTGGQGAEGQHYGEIIKIKHLPKNTASMWSKEVPFYWSVYTIYAESVIQALKRTGMEDSFKKFNFQYLMANCLVFDTNYRDRVYQVYQNKNIFYKVKIYYYFIKIWIKRLNFHFKINYNLMIGNRFKLNKKMVNKENIYAVAIYNDELIGETVNF